MPVSTLALETDNLLHCVEFNIDSQINKTHDIDFRSTVYAHIHRQCWSAVGRYHYMYVVIPDWACTCVSQILPYTNCRLSLLYTANNRNMPVNTTTKKLKILGPAIPMINSITYSFLLTLFGLGSELSSPNEKKNTDINPVKVVTEVKVIRSSFNYGSHDTHSGQPANHKYFNFHTIHI